MNIGFSLTTEFLAGTPIKTGDKALLDKYQSPESFLETLKERGVHYIELRNVKPGMDNKLVLDAVKTVRSAGMDITIHGVLGENDTGKSFFEIFPSIAGILELIPDHPDRVIITVHTYSDKTGHSDELSERTIKTVSRWVELMDKGDLPFNVAVEINRSKGIVDPSVSCEGVMRIVEGINHGRVGVCWDMGHYYTNFKNGVAEKMPGEDFIKKVIHTHIHGIGEQGTHYPVILPEAGFLIPYINKLKSREYKGVYNLELTFDKFFMDTPADAAALKSIDQLKFILSMEESEGTESV